MARLRSAPPTVRLPGVGERLDVTDGDGRPVQFVRRNDGHVEVHAGGVFLELDPATARAMAAFVAGYYAISPALADRLADARVALTLDWVRLDDGDHAAGRTIGELEIRRRTGVSIVAVLRGSIPIVTPDPSLRLESGDDLVVTGLDDDRDAFAAFLAEGRTHGP